MAQDQAPDIVLEFKGGMMTIRTEKALYHVAVTALGDGAQVLPPSGGQPTLPGFPQPEAPQPPPAPAQVEQNGARGLLPPAAEPSLGRRSDEFYSELSHETLREVGTLTRRLSSSLAKLARVRENGEAGGDGLPALAKEMNQNLAKAREIVGGLRQEQEAQRQAAAGRRKLAKALAEAAQAPAPAQNPLARRAGALASELTAAGGSKGETEYGFDLDRVFEAVYEHCANPTVRKHIRATWDDAAAFDQAALQVAMNRLAASAPEEAGELLLPLEQVLAALQEATSSTRYQQILAKMQNTAPQIFPDLDLRLPAPLVGAATPAGASPQLIKRVVKLLKQVSQAEPSGAAAAVPAQLIKAAQEPDDDLAQAQQLGNLERGLLGLEDMVAGMGDAGSSRLDRQMMRLLGDLQVQMLVLLVSFGAKLEGKQNEAGLNGYEAEQVAQRKVGKALEAINPPGLGDDHSMQADPKAIDALLETLGF
jgi:hypothetical protein